jgi:hypothetical protein
MWAVEGLTDLGDVMFCQKNLYESCRMGRCIVVMKLIYLLGHCECDGHTVHKLSQRRLTAETSVNSCQLIPCYTPEE